MVENNSVSEQDTFARFNESRRVLAQQFYDLIGVVGNHVFHGNLNMDNPNIFEEINKQEDLLEPEKNVLRNLYFYSSNLLASRFLLGVMGRFKAGKSTVLNALSGENISPMDTRISTGVLNFTYRSEEEECIVIYDSGLEDKIDPGKKRKYVDCRYNPDNEMGVHSVRHGSPRLDLQKEIEFVDTPGLEAVNSVHEKITLDFVAQCHAAIVVSTYPPFGEHELRFYERIKDDIPNVFLVQNLPSDKLKDWIELESQTLENLHKLGFYQLHKNYGNKELRDILTKISDTRDEKELIRFKEIHEIHIYSVNARDAYQAVMGYLFDLAANLHRDLSPEEGISDEIWQAFKKKGHMVSQNSKITIRKKDEEWLLKDGSQEYLLVKEKEVLRVYGRKQEMTVEHQELFESSRFHLLKQDLYSFLAENKGRKMIETYLLKGKVVLDELLGMVNSKIDILQNSLDEIESKIREEEERKHDVQNTISLVADRTKLRLMEVYKNLKTMIMEEDLRILLNELNKLYGDINVYRLRKEQVKEIKNQISEFKRLFGQRHQDFVKEVEIVLEESRENVLKLLANHGVLNSLQIPRTSISLGIVELAGAGLIEDGFKIIFHGGLAYAGGAIAGGSGLALLSAPLVAIGIVSAPASLAVGALLGGAIGLGISFPLEKHAAPVLDVFKGLIGKFAHKSTRSLFDQFRNTVREKLDEIEITMVDRVITNFRSEVTRNSQEYLELFTKTLHDLKAKKENGQEQQEHQKLTSIMEQLEGFQQQFIDFGKQQGLEDNKMQGMLKGIKGFIKKFNQ